MKLHAYINYIGLYNINWNYVNMENRTYKYSVPETYKRLLFCKAKSGVLASDFQSPRKEIRDEASSSSSSEEEAPDVSMETMQIK